MKRITFAIPGKPVPKGRPRVTRSGRVYTPKATRDYESLVRVDAMCEALDTTEHIVRTRAINGRGIVRKLDPNGVAGAMLYRYVGGES